MVWFGYVAIVVAVLWILWKLRVAYGSEGGTVMVVIYDAALYPPMLIALGLYFVLPTYQVEWPLWTYFAIWLAATLLVAGAIRLMVELGDRPL